MLRYFVSVDTIVPRVEDAKGGAAATIGAILNHKLTVDFHDPAWVSAMQQEDDKQKEKHTEDADKKGSNSDQWEPTNPQTLNRYAYALNNPVKYTDPTGHFFFISLLVAAAVGFGSGVALDVGIDYVTAEDKSKFDVGASIGNSVRDPWTWVGAIPVVGWAGKGAKVVGVASKATKFAAGGSKVVRVAAPLTTAQKKPLWAGARKLYDTVNPGRRAALQHLNIDVHHRIPLEYAHLFPSANPNRFANLIGVENRIHKQISSRWTSFRTYYGRLGRSPTASEVQAFSRQIDTEFSRYYR